MISWLGPSREREERGCMTAAAIVSKLVWFEGREVYRKCGYSCNWVRFVE
jgi:hypothetical protein